MMNVLVVVCVTLGGLVLILGFSGCRCLVWVGFCFVVWRFVVF